MDVLKGAEALEAERWMHAAAEAAKRALCRRAKCGTVIVMDGEIIGAGYNAPPLDDEAHRMCDAPKEGGKPGYDRTCCMHAEWRAIMDALAKHPDRLKGSSLYFTRVDEAGAVKRSGEPYCTVCSRLALDIGIATFHLWQVAGIRAYPTDLYNRLSYAYPDART